MFRAHRKILQITNALPAKTARFKRLRKEVILGTGAFIAFVVVVQLLYPSNRSLPFASAQGASLGYKTTAEIGSVMQKFFEESSAHITASRLSVDAKLSSLGAELDVDKTAAQVMTYPWWQRLLPFSILWSRPKVDQLYITFTTEQLGYASASLTKKLTAPAKNGAVSIDENGEIILTSAEQSVTVTEALVKKALTNATFSVGVSPLSVEATVVEPEITNEDIEKVQATITTALEREVTLTNSLSSETYTPTKKDRAAWIKIGDDLSLALNKDAVLNYANTVAKGQLIVAGTTKVTVVDGVETGRIVGTTGRGVNSDSLVSDLTKVILEGSGTSVKLQFQTVAPTVSYSRSYTNSQAALQAYINDVTSGGNIEISVTQLDGAGWSASSGASKSVVAASTYKLFISLTLFDKIAAGQIHWSDSIQGTTVETCLYNTIIYSANNCAEQWIGEWGRSWINSALYAKGFSSATTFTASDATHTAAGDLKKLLIGLYNQTLFNSSDASRLLGFMKKQVYRSGIPAGSAGTVADKVGFLWDYLNDAAIVYHPRGTYVLVVMTKGESWGKIAEITRQIEKIMYP